MLHPIRLCVFPAGGLKIASSRVRIYGIESALRVAGVDLVYNDPRNADVVLVQKKVNAEILSAALAAQKDGAVLWYDCDDFGDALDYWAPRDWFHGIMRAAEVVTTNTPGYYNQLRLDRPSGPIEITPDVVDYGPSAPVPAPHLEQPPLRIIWYGNWKNLRLLEPYASEAMRTPACRLTICTDPRCSAERIPGADFIPWSFETFPQVLRMHHLALLSHDGNEYDLLKSNNRMITAIAWGVPALVSRTSEYARTAVRLSAEDSIVAGPTDVGRAIENYRDPARRSQYIDVAQPFIWKTHSPEAVGRQIIDLMARYLRKRRSSAACPNGTK